MSRNRLVSCYSYYYTGRNHCCFSLGGVHFWSPNSEVSKINSGKVCTFCLGCQTLRLAASRRAKSLGVETKAVRMPRCNRQGGFEPVQCDNEIVSSCWCVDEAGFERPGTRAPAAALVNCTGKDQEDMFRS